MICFRLLNEYNPRTSWPGFLVTSGIAITLIFSALMPASSQPLHVGWLFVFWGAHVSAGLLILSIVQSYLERTPASKYLKSFWLVGLSGVISALIFSPFAYLLDFAFGVPEDADDIGQGLLGSIIGEFFGLLPLFLLVWVVLNAIRFVRVEPSARRTKPIVKTKPVFWDKVPTALGRDIVALSAELHYLRVYTTRGDALILYSFGKAVSELDGLVEGAQVHRSHWVSIAHVKSLETRGQGGICLTATGLSLPVSRARKKALDLDFVTKT